MKGEQLQINGISCPHCGCMVKDKWISEQKEPEEDVTCPTCDKKIIYRRDIDYITLGSAYINHSLRKETE